MLKSLYADNDKLTSRGLKLNSCATDKTTRQRKGGSWEHPEVPDEGFQSYIPRRQAGASTAKKLIKVLHHHASFILLYLET